MKVRKRLEWILKIGVIVFLFFTFQTSENEHAMAVNNNINEQQLVTFETQAEHELLHQDIIRLTEEFMYVLVQKTDQNNKVIQYDTKKDLIQAFEKIASKETVLDYVNYYYREESDGLYIVPTETPPWFNSENNYDVVQLNNKSVEIMQQNSSDLHGDYMIKIEFTYDNDWRITNIDHIY